MNNEEFKFYQKLQSIFPRDWQMGDRIYSAAGFGVVFDIEEKAIGIKFEKPGFKIVWIDRRTVAVEHGFFHLPIPIDPGDPERIARGEQARGLWHMVNWDKWTFGNRQDGGAWMHHQLKYIEFNEATPTLALLKALKVQKGVDKETK